MTVPQEHLAPGDDSNAGLDEERQLGWWGRVRSVYTEHVGAAEQALLLSWAAFAATFGAVRLITYALKRRDAGSGGSGGLVVAGKHLHHYNLGIALLTTVGGIAVHGEQRRRQHPLTALAYGGGAALVVDELALLLDLDDVYWSKQGRTSVDAAVGVVGVGGLLLAAVPFWKGLVKETVGVGSGRGARSG